MILPKKQNLLGTHRHSSSSHHGVEILTDLVYRIHPNLTPMAHPTQQTNTCFSTQKDEGAGCPIVHLSMYYSYYLPQMAIKYISKLLFHHLAIYFIYRMPKTIFLFHAWNNCQPPKIMCRQHYFSLCNETPRVVLSTNNHLEHMIKKIYN